VNVIFSGNIFSLSQSCYFETTRVSVIAIG